MRDDLESPTRRNYALPAELKLLATLRFYACGSFQQVVGDTVHIAQPTMSRVIAVVTTTLNHSLKRIIKFPRQEDTPQLCADFYKIARFPGVMGVVDGTHVWILGPSFHEWRYVNRKNWYSIKVQVVFDAHFRFINVVARWPGSTHDSVVLRESAVTDIMRLGRRLGHPW